MTAVIDRHQHTPAPVARGRDPFRARYHVVLAQGFDADGPVGTCRDFGSTDCPREALTLRQKATAASWALGWGLDAFITDAGGAPLDLGVDDPVSAH